LNSNYSDLFDSNDNGRMTSLLARKNKKYNEKI